MNQEVHPPEVPGVYLLVLLVAKTTPGYAGGPKELIARKGVDNKKTPH